MTPAHDKSSKVAAGQKGKKKKWARTRDKSTCIAAAANKILQHVNRDKETSFNWPLEQDLMQT